MITINAACRRYVLLPPMFGPVSTIMFCLGLLGVAPCGSLCPDADDPDDDRDDDESRNRSFGMKRSLPASSWSSITG